MDSTKKNKEGKPYRIENTIDIQHELMPSATPGHQVVKVKVVPPSAKLLFTTDNTNPANNGKPYSKPGIDALEGSTVRLFAEKVPVSVEKSRPDPEGNRKGGGSSGPKLDPDLPATVNGKGFSALVTRSATYQFLARVLRTAPYEIVCPGCLGDLPLLCP